MNSKRRAELQRKLTLNAVPRPPAGLAERIKADIPKYLEAETAPQRFSRSVSWPLRIAASLVLLVGAAAIAVMFVRAPQEKTTSAAAGRPIIFAPAPRAMAPAETATTAAVARTEEVTLDIVQERAPQIASAPVVRDLPREFAREDQAESDNAAAEADIESGVEGEATSVSGGIVGGVVGGTAGGRIAQPQQQVAELAPAPPPSAAPPLPEPISVTAEAPAVYDEALRRERRQDAAKLAATAAAPPEAKREASVFGITVSKDVFHDIRALLEAGLRPAPSKVDVEALVNYFAGAPDRRPRGVRLEVEASPALIPADGEHAVLRFTVDTPAGTGVAASDARIEVDIAGDAVANAQRIGDGEPLARESMLVHGTSVTGLYSLEMKPGLRDTQRVATIRLHYTIAGKPFTIAESVHGRDLGKPWQRASRRHRLASLGALWAQSLKGAPDGVEVAKRAQELATQEPGDALARELARAAIASGAGGK